MDTFFEFCKILQNSSEQNTPLNPWLEFDKSFKIAIIWNYVPRKFRFAKMA